MTVTETLRTALLAKLKTVTLYRVREETGVSWQALDRFAKGAGDLRGKQLNALAEYLGLELRQS